MKYIKFKTSILTVAITILANGCDTFVEPKYEPEFPWQNIDQLEMAVALPYTAFTGGAWGEPIGIYTEYEVLATDFGTAITDAAPNNEWPQWVGRTHRQVGIEALGWTQGVYKNIFGAIAGCNEALEFLNSGEPKVLFPNDTENKLAEIPRAKAELYFWRGFSYYWAALYFTPPYNPQGGNEDRVLPLKKTNLNANNTYIGTTKELWEFIIDDLKEAKSLMPKTFHIPGRVDYYTICGALARAYFYTGRFTEAEAECSEIIDSNKYGLSENVLEAWQVQQAGGLPDSEPKEVIWMYTTNSQGQYIEVFTVFTRAFPYDWGEVPVEYGRGKGSEGMWIGCRLSDAMVKKLGWMVDPENGNYTETQLARDDKRYHNTWWRVEGYKPRADVEAEVEATGNEAIWDKYTYQYASQTHPFIYIDKFYRGQNARKTNYPRMRLAEFILMRSAIRFNNGNAQGAASDLKRIRDRAGLPDIPAGSLTASDIDREFIIEMGGEGGYLPYLIAMQRPILPGDRKGVGNVNPPYTGWYWKIPINEVSINAGYKDIPDPNSK